MKKFIAYEDRNGDSIYSALLAEIDTSELSDKDQESLKKDGNYGIDPIGYVYFGYNNGRIIINKQMDDSWGVNTDDVYDDYEDAIRIVKPTMKPLIKMTFRNKL
jgi:hypothetical protein